MNKPVRLVHVLVTAMVVLGMTGCASISRSITGNRDSRGTSKNAEECHPEPDSAAPQYVIGYGSLMQEESRKRTSPNAGLAEPVEVAGFRRGWFSKGGPVDSAQRSWASSQLPAVT